MQASDVIMRTNNKRGEREFLVDVQRRLPAGQRFIQEAFTTDHRRAVVVKVTELRTNTFYLFDEITVRAICDAVIDRAAHDGDDRLVISFPFYGEYRAQKNRLQLVANKVKEIRLLAVGQAVADSAARSGGISFRNIVGNPLVRFTIALKEGARPMLFICRDAQRHMNSDRRRSLGFFSFDTDIIEEIADDIELVQRDAANRLTAFDRLELLHQTTQRVARELESYSRRMELAVRRARRRPHLLTQARFERIVGQATTKMGQLEEIPRRGVRGVER